MYTLFLPITRIASEIIIFQSSGRSFVRRGLVTRERIEKGKDSARTRCGSCCWLRVFPRGTSQELSTKGSFDVIKKVSPAERTEEIKRYPMRPVETAHEKSRYLLPSYLENTLTRINPLNHGVK